MQSRFSSTAASTVSFPKRCPLYPHMRQCRPVPDRLRFLALEDELDAFLPPAAPPLLPTTWSRGAKQTRESICSHTVHSMVVSRSVPSLKAGEMRPMWLATISFCCATRRIRCGLREAGCMKGAERVGRGASEASVRKAQAGEKGGY